MVKKDLWNQVFAVLKQSVVKTCFEQSVFIFNTIHV